MAKITYDDKIALIENADIPDINKVKSTDMNEIKSVVNENDDKFLTNGLNLSNEVDEDYRVNLLETKNLCSGYNQSLYINSGVNQAKIVSGNTGLYIPVSGGDYTISTTDTQTIYRVGLTLNVPNTNSQTLYSGINKDNTSDSITIDTTGYSYLCITCTDLSKIQIEKGSTATTYEAFVPNSIVVEGEKFTDTINVGNIENNKDKVNILLSNNLFNKESEMIAGSSATSIVLDTGIRVKNTSTGTARYVSLKLANADDLLGKTLTISATISASAQNNAMIRIYWLNKRSFGSLIAETISSTGSSTFTIPSSYPSNSDGIIIVFYSNLNSSTSAIDDYIDYTNVMLNIGTEALPYESYIYPKIKADCTTCYDYKNVITLQQESTKSVELKSWHTYKIYSGGYYTFKMYGIYNSVQFAGYFTNAMTAVVNHLLYGSPTITFTNVSGGAQTISIPGSSAIILEILPNMTVEDITT